jgi:hypothetical protein
LSTYENTLSSREKTRLIARACFVSQQDRGDLYELLGTKARIRECSFLLGWSTPFDILSGKEKKLQRKQRRRQRREDATREAMENSERSYYEVDLPEDDRKTVSATVSVAGEKISESPTTSAENVTKAAKDPRILSRQTGTKNLVAIPVNWHKTVFRAAKTSDTINPAAESSPRGEPEKPPAVVKAQKEEAAREAAAAAAAEAARQEQLSTRQEKEKNQSLEEGELDQSGASRAEIDRTAEQMLRGIGRHKKRYPTAWQQSSSFVVEVDNSVNYTQRSNRSPGSHGGHHNHSGCLEYDTSTPNTSLHFLFSPPTTGNDHELEDLGERREKSESAKSVTLVSRTSKHLILRKKRAVPLSDDIETPSKRACHR